MTEGRKSEVALLVGAGDAIGAAVARRFAAGGYSVCIARRDAEKVLKRSAGDHRIRRYRGHCQYRRAQ